MRTAESRRDNPPATAIPGNFDVHNQLRRIGQADGVWLEGSCLSDPEIQNDRLNGDRSSNG